MGVVRWPRKCGGKFRGILQKGGVNSRNFFFGGSGGGNLLSDSKLCFNEKVQKKPIRF